MVKEIISLLPPQARRRSWRVALAVLVRAVLDFAGVAALIPLLLAVLRPGGSRGEMLLLCGAVMGFVVLKNVLVVAWHGWKVPFNWKYIATSAGGCLSITTGADCCS